jgi:hypothetical protein
MDVPLFFYEKNEEIGYKLCKKGGQDALRFMRLSGLVPRRGQSILEKKIRGFSLRASAGGRNCCIRHTS